MPTQNTRFRIATLPGDGIGREIVPAALHVLGIVEKAVGGFTLDVQERLDMGALYYRDSGEDMSKSAFEAASSADAILIGAMGWPAIRYPDGTEIAPHLKLREAFGLYAGVRPVKAFPNTPRRLLDERASQIDFVVLRESTEGLFFTQGRGEVIGDSEARETLRITRATTREAVRCGVPHRAPPQGAQSGQGVRHLRRQGQRVPCLRLLPQDLRREEGPVPRHSHQPQLRRRAGAGPDPAALGLRRAGDGEHVRRHHLRPRRRAGRRHGPRPVRRTRRCARPVPASARQCARHRRPGQGQSDRHHPLARP